MCLKEHKHLYPITQQSPQLDLTSCLVFIFAVTVQLIMKNKKIYVVRQRAYIHGIMRPNFLILKLRVQIKYLNENGINAFSIPNYWSFDFCIIYYKFRYILLLNYQLFILFTPNY